MTFESRTHFSRKQDPVRDGVVTLHASKQVLCHVWLYHFYDMALLH